LTRPPDTRTVSPRSAGSPRRALVRSREIIRHSRALLRKAHSTQLDLLCKLDALHAAQLRLRTERTRDNDQPVPARREIVSGPKWALAYVDGRARAFRRGNQPLSAVLGSIDMARHRGVSDFAIAAILRKWDLSWDSTAGRITVLPHDTAQTASPRQSRSPAPLRGEV